LLVDAEEEAAVGGDCEAADGVRVLVGEGAAPVCDQVEGRDPVVECGGGGWVVGCGLVVVVVCGSVGGLWVGWFWVGGGGLGW
jgi:hypothetical protein